MTVVEELTETELECQGCHHGWGAHNLEELPGGHCRAAVANSATYRLPCPCPGFRWLPAAAGPVSYTGTPAPAFPR